MVQVAEIVATAGSIFEGVNEIFREILGDLGGAGAGGHGDRSDSIYITGIGDAVT